MRKENNIWLDILRAVGLRDRGVVALVVIFALVLLALALAGCAGTARLDAAWDVQGQADVSRPSVLSLPPQQPVLVLPR